MTIKPRKCPFNIGDLIVYRASRKGIDSDVMSDAAGRLVPGETYRVVDIQQGLYVVVDGYSHPGGGIYWTEFEPA